MNNNHVISSFGHVVGTSGPILWWDKFLEHVEYYINQLPET